LNCIRLSSIHYRFVLSFVGCCLFCRDTRQTLRRQAASAPARTMHGSTSESPIGAEGSTLGSPPMPSSVDPVRAHARQHHPWPCGLTTPSTTASPINSHRPWQASPTNTCHHNYYPRHISPACRTGLHAGRHCETCQNERTNYQPQ
jgi:hypothetical protein